ncbi:MAG TPA: hypothetical protein VJ246_03585, partial [Patescibacteria group bacterium]|nr:hypothetical protein [Patescibacteria group bacterium]
MNILVPHEWLKNHLETHATPEEIQRILSLCGPSVERIEEVDGDRVFDIEVTTNRMDTASVRGIAREASVILPYAGKDAALTPLHVYVPKSGDITHLPEDFPIAIQNDPSMCSRVTCVILNVKIKES